MLLTADMLYGLGACIKGVEVFEKLFIDVMNVNSKTLAMVYAEEGDPIWAVCILPEETQDKFVAWCLNRILHLTNEAAKRARLADDRRRLKHIYACRVAARCRKAKADSELSENRKEIVKEEYEAQLTYLGQLFDTT
jgi:DNA mismatch repair ATPase MutL